MAATIKQVEAIPAGYPAAPSGLSAEAAALDPDAVWQRIEAYIVHRFSLRQVTWTAKGSGEWVPLLTPATIDTTEIWCDATWQSVTLTPSPLDGYELDGEGPYKFVCTVGTATVPPVVSEAFRRLAEYMAGDAKTPGATSEKYDIGTVTIERSRAAAWMARAMANSGAGDLLRPYRFGNLTKSELQLVFGSSHFARQHFP